ncbi:MAG: PAS domain S-box protein [bacterium]
MGLVVNGYVILHFIAAAIYLAIGFYAIRLDPKARLNRIFLVICLLCFIWALAIALILIEDNAAVASLLYLLTSMGWGFGPGLVLAFSLEMSRRRSSLPFWLVFLICTLPGWLIFGRSVADFLLTTNLAMGTQVGGNSFDLSLWWHYFYIAYYLLYLIGSALMISVWGHRSSLRREKLQARWVAISLAVGVFLSFLNESLLPQMGIEVMMQIPSVIMLVWIFGMLAAITRYRLMVLTPALATEEIASRMKDLLVLVDTQGRIAMVNRKTEELLGFRRVELMGQPLSLILKESHLVPQELRQMRLSAGQNHIQQRLTFLGKGGSREIPVEVATTGLRDRAGDYLGIVLVAQDLRMTLQLEHEIAERRQAEEDLRKSATELEQRVEERTRALNLANNALRESEAEYRIVVEQANDGIVMLQGGRILFANPRFLRMSGYANEHFLILQFPQVVAKEKLANIEEWLQRLEQGDTPEALEFDLIRVDGSALPVEASAGPLRFRDRPAALLVLRDTSERKEAERRMQKARSDLLFAVSHELKTPLMTMLQAQEMLNELEDQEALIRFRDYQETWQRNLLRLHRMINNLVDSQRTAETAFPLRLVSSRVEEIVTSVQHELAGYARTLQVDLQLQMEAMPARPLDVEAIGRVVENLVSNAIKFSHKGGSVDLRLRMEDETLLFQVEDQGSGISLPEQERLFQPFARGRDADRRGIPGTGLGLYVSRRIVEEHGGSLTLESEEGKGTRVTVRLSRLGSGLYI